jgi:3-dehydrosphinganine reductase
MPEYRDKRAFITGGSSGIGLALARKLAAAGAQVAIAARGVDALEAARLELQGLAPEGVTVRAYPLDVGDREAVSDVSARALEDLGGIDLLVNNAGIAHPGYVHELPDEIFEDMVRVNYLGTVWVTRAFLPALMAQGSGQVVNVSSIAGVLGAFGYSAYGGSKFAVTGFTEVLRQELKPHGIAVSLLCPPDTDTPQLAYEDEFKPDETRALSGNLRAMSADAVAQALLDGVAAGRPEIVPGLDGWFTVFMARRFPGLVRWIMDRDIARASAVRRGA